MFETIKDQAKAIWANKFTLTGYIIPTVTLPAALYLKSSGIITNDTLSLLTAIPTFFSLAALGATGGGLGTYDKYVSAREQIERYGKVRDDFKNKCQKYYCYRKGIELAEQEAGLESKVRN